MNSDPKNASGPQPPSGAPPELFNYTNFREYLNDYYKYHKKLNSRFSLRFLAKKAKFPSHGLLSFVMDGKRNLSKNSLVKLIAALELDKAHAHYFENLVFFNQAKKLQEKNFFYEELLNSHSNSKFKSLSASQLQVFRKWHPIAIREMINLKDFRSNSAWIESRLLPEVDQAEIEASLRLLLSTGLIKRTANGLAFADPDITTQDEVKSFLVKNYHTQMLSMAAWAQDNVPGPDRDISSVCFAIKESELPNLKKQIQLMRKELRNFAAKAGEGERVMQVNIQLFPMTRGKSK